MPGNDSADIYYEALLELRLEFVFGGKQIESLLGTDGLGFRGVEFVAVGFRVRCRHTMAFPA